MTAKICFTMDNLSDAADLGRGIIDKPRAPGQRPALEQGFPALLEMFESFDVKVTHFLEGWNGEAHPEIVEDIVRRGHSIGMHGWQHEPWSELSIDQETELAGRSTEALEKAAGIRPRAFRAPGGKRTENTIKIISDLGYEIDSSLNDKGEDGGEIQALTNTLWHVPHLEATIDARQWLSQDKSTEAVEGMWLDMLDRTSENNGFLLFIWHPHVMGINAERLKVGEKILQKASQSAEFSIVRLEDLIPASRQEKQFPD
tara:strand:+ start:3892 stop:4665 length:774 start_codon:yes stop_codon:yes gene_type:complete